MLTIASHGDFGNALQIIPSVKEGSELIISASCILTKWCSLLYIYLHNPNKSSWSSMLGKKRSYILGYTSILCNNLFLPPQARYTIQSLSITWCLCAIELAQQSFTRSSMTAVTSPLSWSQNLSALQYINTSTGAQSVLVTIRHSKCSRFSAIYLQVQPRVHNWRSELVKLLNCNGLQLS